MANINDIYPGGNFLNSQTVKAEGLQGKQLTIKSARVDEIGKDDKKKSKVVIAFNEIGKELALNKTNASILAEKWGEDFSAWINKKLQLMVVKVSYQGNLVDGIQCVAL